MHHVAAVNVRCGLEPNFINQAFMQGQSLQIQSGKQNAEQDWHDIVAKVDRKASQRLFQHNKPQQTRYETRKWLDLGLVHWQYPCYDPSDVHHFSKEPFSQGAWLCDIKEEFVNEQWDGYYSHWILSRPWDDEGLRHCRFNLRQSQSLDCEEDYGKWQVDRLAWITAVRKPQKT